MPQFFLLNIDRVCIPKVCRNKNMSTMFCNGEFYLKYRYQEIRLIFGMKSCCEIQLGNIQIDANKNEALFD